MSATPILDLEQDPPKPHSNWIVIAVCLAIGGALGYLPSAFGHDLPGFNGLLWLPFLYVAVAIHELAHLVVGKVTGMAPGGIIIGGFIAMKSGSRWKVRFDPRRIFGGGLAIPLPSKDRFHVMGFAWMVAAGPIASVLSTLACWLAFREFGSGTWDWIGSAFWAAAVGLTSAIPMSAGIHKSDATRIWTLLTKPDQARSWMAAVAVQAENMNGVRPRDWDRDLVEQMLSPGATGTAQVFPHLMGFMRRLDERRVPEALCHLESAIAASAHAGKAVRQVLFLQAAEMRAVNGDTAGARTWRDRALKIRRPESVACTGSAISMAEGRYEDSLRDITEARAWLAKRGMNSGAAHAANDWLDEREQRCRDALRTAV